MRWPTVPISTRRACRSPTRRSACEGARSLTKPQLDLVGVMQNNGLAGQANPFVPNPDPGFLGGYGSVLDQIFARNYPTYGVGVQMTLPIRNRIAEADLVRDEMQVKQSEIRLRQLQNQARLEVEDALIAMRRARASYDAAVQARALQQESLAAEQAKFEVGASTSFFVIQYESLLAQARSTEVAAQKFLREGARPRCNARWAPSWTKTTSASKPPSKESSV